MARALLGCGHFAHVSVKAIEFDIDCLYQREEWYQDDNGERNSAVPTEVRAIVCAGHCPPVYFARGTMRWVRSRNGSLCCLCGEVEFNSWYDLSVDMAHYVSQRFLRIAGDDLGQWYVSPTCSACTRNLEKPLPDDARYGEAELPVRLARLVASATFRQRAISNAQVWSELRFDPRRYEEIPVALPKRRYTRRPLDFAPETN